MSTIQDKRSAIAVSGGRVAAALISLAALLAVVGTALLVAGRAAAQSAGGGAHVPPEAWGLGLLAAALATGLSSLAGGYAVARVGAAAVGALAEKPDLFGRMLILVGLAEGIAIYGVIVAILILDRLA